jgi:parallel beta-helix repeat protein
VGLGGNGGGISLTYFSSPLIQNNLIQGNTAWNSGGGISVQSYDSPMIVQNVIVNNSSLGGGSGGGVWVSPSSSSSQQTFLNNTIAGNTASDNTSGIYVFGFGQYATFVNNVVAAATGQVAVTCSSLYSSISPVFSYNDAFSSSGQNWSGICDTTNQPGNVSTDPRLLSATDSHLQWGSPAVDAGNNSAPNLPNTDFDGNPRVVDGNGDGIAVVDLGAYELSPTTISWSPNSLTFAAQAPGSTSASQAVTLTNTGNQKLLLAVSVDANFVETDDCGSSVASGGSCTINVSFSPTASGNITANLTLKDTASGSPQTVPLAGTGGAPAVTLTPTSLNFGSQPEGVTSAPQTITLTNSGSDVLGIASITKGASSGFFSETNNCGTTLAPGANCTISVTFTPGAGTESDVITITDNAPGSPQTVPLRAQARRPSSRFRQQA